MPILSVLIGFMLAGILAGSMSSIVQLGIRGGTTVRNHSSYDALQISIQNILQNPETCRSAFKMGSGEPLAIPLKGPIEISLGNTRLAAAGMMLGEQARIVALEIELVSGPTSLSNGNNLYGALLKLEVSKNPNSYGSRIISNSLDPLYFNIETDATGSLASCYHRVPSVAAQPQSAKIETGYVRGSGWKNIGRDWKVVQAQVEIGNAQPNPFVAAITVYFQRLENGKVRVTSGYFGAEAKFRVVESSIEYALDTDPVGVLNFVMKRENNGEYAIRGRAIYTVFY